MEKWTDRAKKICIPRLMAIGLTVLYCVSLIPIMVLSNYNAPSADDYTNGSACYHVWQTSHSMLKVLGAAFKRTCNEWIEWRGCFSSSFLSCLPPNIWGESMYFFTTWLVLGMLSVSTIYLIYAILVKVFGADKYTSHSIAMLVLLVSVHCMCPSGRVEAFFWYSGAINYTFMHGVELFFFGLLVSIVYDKGKKRIWDAVAASVLGFLTAGANQMTMLNTAIVLAIVVAFITYHKQWKRYQGLGLPIGIFYLGCILAIIAPGNFVRASSTSGMNPVKAIFVSFYYCLDLALSEWTTWPVILVMLAMVPMFWHIAKKTTFRFRYPFIVVIFGYCLVSAMVTPPLFALGNIEAGRLQAQMFLMYMLVVSMCIGYVTGWIRKHFENGQEKLTKKNIGYGESSCIWLLGCFIFLMFGSAITLLPEHHYYTCTSAMADLANGNASAYKSEMNERAKVYQGKSEGVVKVEALKVQPALLYFDDITEDDQDWKNLGVARFYNLDGVVVE